MQKLMKNEYFKKGWHIENLRGDVASVFSNINCVVLAIDKMSLSSADTQALVSAMDTRVWEVNLHEGVTLDLETLTQYDGTGKCEFLRTWNIKLGKEYEECFEVDENEEEDGLNSDNEVENELIHANGKEEIDFGDNVVNETTEEQHSQDLA